MVAFASNSPLVYHHHLSHLAVDIFYWALQKGEYKSFLRSDSALPMMYMPDCLKATTMLLEAPPESLKQRCVVVAGLVRAPCGCH